MGDEIMDLTAAWRRKKRDQRFFALDHLVRTFKAATDDKDEDRIQSTIDAAIAFSNKKRGMENMRAMYYVKVMREIRRDGWNYVEEEHERIKQWLKNKTAVTDEVWQTGPELSELDKKKVKT